MGTFHSAVNRIPVLRRKAHNLVAKGMLPKDIFGDGKAPGHDHLEREGWSGTIDLEITVRTPLVFGDQYREDAEGNRLKESDESKKIPGSRNVVKVPMDGLGRPFISPTMVKGMISRAYETLTVSRFRVFGEHRDPLTYRVDPSQANQLFPARVCRDEAGDLAVEILNGKGQKNEMALLVDSLSIKNIAIIREGHTQPALNAQAPQHPRIPGAGHLLPEEQVLKRFRSLTPHGEKVSVGLTRLKDGRRVVTHVQREGTDELEEFFRVTRKGCQSARPIEVEGYACRTAPEGKFASDLFENKKYEKFFFKIDSSENDISGTILRLTETNVRDYGLIVKSYRKESDEYKGPEPHLLNRASQKRENPEVNDASTQAEDAPASAGDASEPTGNALTRADGTPALAGSTATSASSASGSTGSALALAGGEPAPALAEGDLVFVRLDTDEVPDCYGKTCKNITVCEVLPTMVGRRAYRSSPRELAENQLVAPLKNRDEASPADRLFGYVVPETIDNAKGGDVAYRGRIAVGPVDTSRAKLSHEEKKLAPLLEPKVSSARRFLTDSGGATPRIKRDNESASIAPNDRKQEVSTKEEKEEWRLRDRREYFQPGQLLGTAAYPVYREPRVDETGFLRSATELPQLDLEQGNDDVRITAKTWIETGSSLKCTLRFENLSKFELASLVWVLTPENLVPLEARNRTENAEEKAKSEAGKGDGEEPVKPVGFLRIGLGKPLGLGAVEVRIAEGGLKAWRGRSLAKSYESLEACLGFGAKMRKPSKFSLKKLMREIDPNRHLDLDRLPWIQAMQRAAYGYDDGVEVRYMSMDENKANNQTNSKTGEPQEGRGLSPTDLCGSSPSTKTYRPSPMRISTD